MPFCKSTATVVILITAALVTGSESAHPVVKVKFSGTAVLPCTDTCSGVIRWAVRSNSSYILAECDQTSCRSVKEGYQMIYNQYLQGDLSLIITEADFRKRDWYTSECDSVHLCDVALKIDPLKTTVQVKPGESLLLELDVSDPVEVIYNRSTGEDNGSGVQICTVIGGSLQSKPDYEQRTSLLSALELRGVKESDSGVYTVRDTFNDEIIHIYTVIVHDGDSEQSVGKPELKKGCPSPPSEPLPALLGLVLAGLLLAVCLVLVGVIVRLYRKTQQPKTESVENDDDVEKNRFLMSKLGNNIQKNGRTTIDEEEIV